MLSVFRKPAGVWTCQGASWSNHPNVPLWKRPRSSQCEDWYQTTPWVAEMWCTLTNLPFLYVAWIYGFWPLGVVGLTSLIHHAVPFQWIAECDKLFACAMIGWVVWTVFSNSMWNLSGSLSVCGLLMVADAWSRGHRERGFIHPIWHCGCAWFMYLFLEALDSQNLSM